MKGFGKKTKSNVCAFNLKKNTNTKYVHWKLWENGVGSRTWKLLKLLEGNKFFYKKRESTEEIAKENHNKIVTQKTATFSLRFIAKILLPKSVNSWKGN